MNVDFCLSKADSLVLKGIAIIGMMMWHLFFAPNPMGIEFSPLLRFISILGDFCVSAFLFVSGYGLTISFHNNLQKTNSVGIKSWGGRFVLARLIKFFFNYWFIFLLFVPIGILVFDIPMPSDSRHPIYAWIKQIFALSDQQSYNSAWWFNTLILKYYILFPLLFYFIKKRPVATFCLVVFITVLGSFYGYYHFYLVVFLIGMMWAFYHEIIIVFLKGWREIGLLAVCVASFGLSMIGLFVLGEDGICYYGLPFFGIITIALALTIKCIDMPNVYRRLGYLGKHSGNIYMFHSFLYYYWFPDVFYSFPPIIMFFLLLFSSLFISVIIEKLKIILMWNRLEQSVYTSLPK